VSECGTDPLPGGEALNSRELYFWRVKASTNAGENTVEQNGPLVDGAGLNGCRVAGEVDRGRHDE